MHNQRASERFNCEAPVIIENCETGVNYDGSLYNYSREGMYLELDYPFRPGTELRILIEKEMSPSPLKSCRAKVVWCEEISGAVVLYNYSIGVIKDPMLEFSGIIERFQVIDGGAKQNTP
jgi:hypothetical protein